MSGPSDEEMRAAYGRFVERMMVEANAVEAGRTIVIDAQDEAVDEDVMRRWCAARGINYDEHPDRGFNFDRIVAKWHRGNI